MLALAHYGHLAHLTRFRGFGRNLLGRLYFGILGFWDFSAFLETRPNTAARPLPGGRTGSDPEQVRLYRHSLAITASSIGHPDCVVLSPVLAFGLPAHGLQLGLDLAFPAFSGS
jgi:hypothetical protein